MFERLTRNIFTMHIKTFKKAVAIFMLFAFLCQPAAAFAGGLVDVGDATDYAYSLGASDWNSSGSRTAGQSAEIVGSMNLFLRSPYPAYCTLNPGDKLYHYGIFLDGHFDDFFDGPYFDYSVLNGAYALRPALNLGSSLFLSAATGGKSYSRYAHNIYINGHLLDHHGFFDDFFDGPYFDYSVLNGAYALRPALNLRSSPFLSATQAANRTSP